MSDPLELDSLPSELEPVIQAVRDLDGPPPTKKSEIFDRLARSIADLPPPTGGSFGPAPAAPETGGGLLSGMGGASALGKMTIVFVAGAASGVVGHELLVEERIVVREVKTETAPMPAQPELREPAHREPALPVVPAEPQTTGAIRGGKK